MNKLVTSSNSGRHISQSNIERIPLPANSVRIMCSTRVRGKTHIQHSLLPASFVNRVEPGLKKKKKQKKKNTQKNGEWGGVGGMATDTTNSFALLVLAKALRSRQIILPILTTLAAALENCRIRSCAPNTTNISGTKRV